MATKSTPAKAAPKRDGGTARSRLAAARARDDEATAAPVDPDEPETDDEPEDKPAKRSSKAAGGASKPAAGSIVRLDNPDDESTVPAYAIQVADGIIADLPGARAYQLDTYKA